MADEGMREREPEWLSSLSPFDRAWLRTLCGLPPADYLNQWLGERHGR